MIWFWLFLLSHLLGARVVYVALAMEDDSKYDRILDGVAAIVWELVVIVGVLDRLVLGEKR